MVELKDVLGQLSKVGYKNGLWQRAEVKELCNVLQPDEKIIQAANGHHEGGFGLLVATDHRLILVDRKPMFLTLDSIAYWMIQEASFTYRLLNSTIHIFTSNKCLDFSSWNQTNLRNIMTYTQYAMRQSRPNQVHAMNGNHQPASPVGRYDYVPDQSERRYIPQQPTVATAMEYIEEPEPEPGSIPTMPDPTTQDITPTEAATVNLGALSVSVNDLQTDNTRFTPYTTPRLNERRYVRKY